jgi:hypothetical protein
MFTGWRSKRRPRRQVASPNIIASNAAQARMKKPRPTNDRGSACQTIWCRYASGIAGSMAPFSAKRKGRQSIAPRFVHPPKVQIKQMRGKLLSTSRVSCHRWPSVGRCSSAAPRRAYAKTGPPLGEGGTGGLRRATASNANGPAETPCGAVYADCHAAVVAPGSLTKRRSLIFANGMIVCRCPRCGTETEWWLRSSPQ